MAWEICRHGVPMIAASAINAGQLAVYQDVPADLLELVEDVLLNRRPDATERLIKFAESVKQKGTVERTEDEWRQGPVEERLSHALVKGIVSPAYNVYQPGERLDPAYVDALVRLPVFAQEVTRYSKGVWSSRLRLYPEGFFEVFIPVPPVEEQRAIVEHIAQEAAELSAGQGAIERTIALLKERRVALIAAAVTGQIDVEAVA